MRLDWPPPAVAQLPRAQAALREQLELSERPDDEQAGDGSVLESLLVVLWPRRRTWSELLYWSAVALALAAWGRDDPALGAPIRAAIEAAGEALGARGSARLHAAESQVSQALAEAVVSTPRGTYRASEDAGWKRSAGLLEVADRVSAGSAPAGVRTEAIERLTGAQTVWDLALDTSRRAPPDAGLPTRLRTPRRGGRPAGSRLPARRRRRPRLGARAQRDRGGIGRPLLRAWSRRVR